MSIDPSPEELALSYVRHFDKQFRQLFPGRRKLFLAPLDENRVRHVVCCLFRPSQLPFSEHYYAESAAKWISDFIDISPLRDIFSSAILLSSILSGVGYNNVVAYGYANKLLAQQQFTNLSAPFSTNSPTSTPKNASSSDSSTRPDSSNNPYQIPPRITLKSSFLDRNSRQEDSSATNSSNTNPTAVLHDPDDPLSGRYVHSWVIVLPSARSVTTPFFIDVGTGNIYGPESELFDGLELVFNHENIWVNLQSCEEGCADLDYDLSSSNWEAIFEDDDDVDVIGGEKKVKVPQMVLSKLVLTGNHFKKKFPKYFNSRKYSDGILSRWTKGYRSDGLIERYTTNNYQKLVDLYQNRIDSLTKRVIVSNKETDELHLYPECNCLLTEFYYFPSVCGSLKSMRYFFKVPEFNQFITDVEGQSGDGDGVGKFLSTFKNSAWRSLISFDHHHRADSLSSIVLSKDLMVLNYSNHSEGLVSISLSTLTHDEFEQERAFMPSSAPPTSIGGSYLRNITIDYKLTTSPHKSTDIVAFVDRHIMKIVIDYIGATVNVTFHRRQNALLHEQVEVPRLQTLVQNDNTGIPPEEHEMAVKIKKIENSILDFSRDLIAELDHWKEVFQSFLSLDTVVKAEISGKSLELETSLAQNNDVTTDDVLEPFLPSHYDSNSGPLSPRSALQVKEQYLGAVSRRLVEKAAIVEARLQKEKESLAKIQNSWKTGFESNSSAMEETISQCDLRIQVATMRLAEIEKSATQKYVDETERLRKDPRMSNLPELDKKKGQRRNMRR
ncbi:hypothetical protein GEMRC1_002550 [Eukaryota sp. GEM-RC1]